MPPGILCVPDDKETRTPELHQPFAEPDSLRRIADESRSILVKRSMKGKYDDQAALEGRKFVPEKF